MNTLVRDARLDAAAERTAAWPAIPVFPLSPALSRSLMLVLEREGDAGAVGGDPSVFDRHVEAAAFRHPQVPHRLAGGFHRVPHRALPGVGAGADKLDYLVKAV